MGIAEIKYAQSGGLLPAAQDGKQTEDVEKGGAFSKILEKTQKKCPYNYLEKDGMIEYNGVTFMCDYKTNSICLGDMSNSKEVLNISLPSGGHLKVNIHNFGDLSKAAGMFSPADLNAIMRAIAQYNHCTRKLQELDEEENEIVESADEPGDEKIRETETATEQYAGKLFNDIFGSVELRGKQISIVNQMESGGFQGEKQGKK